MKLLAPLLLAVTLAIPGADPKSTGSVLRISQCLIIAIDDVSVPAQDAGVITSIAVKESGQTVIEKGTSLAQIEDRDLQVKRRLAEFEAAAAKEQAESTVAQEVAEKTAAVAETEWENANDVNKRSPKTYSETEVRRLKLTFERYELEAEKAKLDQRVARLTEQAKLAGMEAVDNDIRKRKLESPVAGVVEKVFKRVGEWVTPGEPVVRVVRMDRLRVEGMLPADAYSPEDVEGRPVSIEVTVTRDGKKVIEKVTGVLDYVSPLIEGGDYRVWVDVDNPQTTNGHWLLRPGQYADMIITLQNSR